MSNIGNKETMSKNLMYYIEKSGKSQKDICEELGFKASTLNEWAKGRKYPRIDKIEILADYFGIMKSDLIEEKMTEKKDNEAMSDIIVRMRMDRDFLSVVESLYSLNGEQLKGVKQMLNAFIK